MAKQAEDTVTAELPLPDAPRRRGRPSTGKAMTPAERKRNQRDVDARNVAEGRYSLVTLESLLAVLGVAVTRGDYDVVVRITSELQGRAARV